MKNRYLSSFLAIGLLSITTNSFAASPRIFLKTKLQNSDKSFSLSLRATDLSQTDCAVSVYGSSSLAQMLATPDRGTRLFQIPATTLPVSVDTMATPALKRSRSIRSSSINLYFRARLECKNSKRFSSIEREGLTTSSTGESSVSSWIKQVGKLLKSILSITPTPTPPTQPTPTATPTTVPTLPALQITEAFPNLSFSSPLYLTNAHNSSGRNFVVEKTGKIFSFTNTAQATDKVQFLDLSAKIATDGERGVVGLTFHPNFASVPYAFVNYAAADGTVTLARFTVSGNPPVADPNSEFDILTIPHARNNHNGGQIEFGPDGFLYMGVGDGGGAGDPDRNGQNRNSLLAKILRLNIDAATNGLNYSIPTTNPFVGVSGTRAEIFAYGFRNPWRFSFDSVTQDLWVGDVGQDAREEVDIVTAGKNYGWNTMEGTACYPAGSSCNTSGLELPVTDYTHAVGQSITGGYLYHGSGIPSLTGYYVYGDFVNGKIFVLRRDTSGAHVTQILDTALSISSFGVDENNELYIVDYGGKIYKLAPQQ